MKTFF